MSWIPKVAKAIAGAATAGGGAYVTAAADGVVTSTEWVSILVATVVAAAAVWAVPNRTEPAPSGS